LRQSHACGESRGTQPRLNFTYVENFNGVEGQDNWVAPADQTDLDALGALFDEWGWEATLYDGAE